MSAADEHGTADRDRSGRFVAKSEGSKEIVLHVEPPKELTEAELEALRKEELARTERAEAKAARRIAARAEMVEKQRVVNDAAAKAEEEHSVMCVLVFEQVGLFQQSHNLFKHSQPGNPHWAAM